VGEWHICAVFAVSRGSNRLCLLDSRPDPPFRSLFRVALVGPVDLISHRYMTRLRELAWRRAPREADRDSVSALARAGVYVPHAQAWAEDKGELATCRHRDGAGQNVRRHSLPYIG